jgi:hypothetical protein
MAFFARRYAQKVAALKQADLAVGSSGGREGRGRPETEAKREMFKGVPEDVTWESFSQRLKRSRRWYDAADRLGWGILCLMPYDAISSTWVEQTMRSSQWLIWLSVVERVNPEAVTASHDLDAWLGAECIAGGPIAERELLGIEAVTSRIQEVPDSESEEGGEEVEEEEDAYDSQSMDVDLFSPAPVDADSPRQLTLYELFKPRSEIEAI